MWPIPTLEQELCTISFSPDSIACSWIQKTNNGLAPLELRAYQRYQLDNLELVHGTIFSPTVVAQYVNAFLHEQNRKNSFVVLSVEGSAIDEQFIALPTSTPHSTDFNIVYSSNSVWGYRYLYPNDAGQFVFYVYSVPRSLVLQYQLLAIKVGCNFIAITTKNMALLSAYKHLFGAAFRRSQLAVDMMHCNNTIDELISSEILKRIIKVPIEVAVHSERSYIATACGLFFDERIY